MKSQSLSANIFKMLTPEPRFLDLDLMKKGGGHPRAFVEVRPVNSGEELHAGVCLPTDKAPDRAGRNTNVPPYPLHSVQLIAVAAALHFNHLPDV